MTKKVLFEVDADLYDQFKTVVKQNGGKIYFVLASVMKYYIEKNEVK